MRNTRITPPNQAIPMTLQVTLSIAVMAVVAAFIGALGETEASHTFFEKNDAVLSQANASDTWAEYQAESMKRHVYTVGAALAAQPEVAEKLKGEVDKYNKEQPVTQEKAKKFEEEVEKHSEIASIALLARRRSFWLVSLGLAGLGMVIAGVAYAI